MNIRTGFSTKEHTDSGLALLLITLILGLLFKQNIAFQIALAEVLVLLVAPVVIYPFTFFWLNLSDFLGKIISKVILTIIFILIVLPVAIFRRLAGKDSLNLKKFKKDTASVFIDRNHSFSRSDFTTGF